MAQEQQEGVGHSEPLPRPGVQPGNRLSATTTINVQRAALVSYLIRLQFYKYYGDPLDPFTNKPVHTQILLFNSLFSILYRLYLYIYLSD